MTKKEILLDYTLTPQKITPSNKKIRVNYQKNFVISIFFRIFALT
jgi:hypothetical protein